MSTDTPEPTTHMLVMGLSVLDDGAVVLLCSPRASRLHDVCNGIQEGHELHDADGNSHGHGQAIPYYMPRSTSCQMCMLMVEVLRAQHPKREVFARDSDPRAQFTHWFMPQFSGFARAHNIRQAQITLGITEPTDPKQARAKRRREKLAKRKDEKRARREAKHAKQEPDP